MFAETGCRCVLDPHTAVGVKVARQLFSQTHEPVERCSEHDVSAKVILATAHHVKFPEAVGAACGDQSVSIPKSAKFEGIFSIYKIIVNKTGNSLLFYNL